MEPKSTAGSDQMPSCLQLGAVLSLLPPPPQNLKRETVQPGPSSQGYVPMVCRKSLESLSSRQQGAPVHTEGHYYP